MPCGELNRGSRPGHHVIMERVRDPRNDRSRCVGDMVLNFSTDVGSFSSVDLPQICCRLCRWGQAQTSCTETSRVSPQTLKHKLGARFTVPLPRTSPHRVASPHHGLSNQPCVWASSTMIKAWAVCAMLVAVSHVALGYPHPFWGQSNGNIYSTFGPTVGPSGQWKPVGSLSSYERLYSENLHTLQSVSPVVSSSGTVFFAVPSCEVGDCPTTPPQVHGLRGPLVGLAAVAANGTELWRTSYVPLLLNRQSLSLGPNQQYLLVSGSQKGLMVFNVDTGKRVFSSSEDYMYSAPAQTFVLGLNTMFGCSEFGGGMQSIIFNVDDDFGFTNSLAWSNPKVGNGTSCRGRPVMDAHSGEYIMALEGCNIVAYHQGDGTRQPMFSAVEDLEFPVAGSTISCSPQLMVNPVTSALVVTGTYHPPASSGRAAGSFVVARYMSSRVVAFTTAGGTVASAAVTSDGAILFGAWHGWLGVLSVLLLCMVCMVLGFLCRCRVGLFACVHSLRLCPLPARTHAQLLATALAPRATHRFRCSVWRPTAAWCTAPSRRASRAASGKCLCSTTTPSRVA